MARFEIEIGESRKRTTCACCGRESFNAFGYVYRDGDAHAIYYAGWSPGHAVKEVNLAIGIGDWGDSASAGDRVGFGVVVGANADWITVRLIGPEESLWPVSGQWGETLSRKAALAHTLREDVFAICELVADQHGAIKDYLEGNVKDQV